MKTKLTIHSGIFLSVLSLCFANISAFGTGGDFTLKFSASAPLSYNHHTGGGAYDDGTVGRDKDIVQSLEGADFACGDVVSFLLVIENDASPANSNQTVEVLSSFSGDSTGQSGVGQIESVSVVINRSPIQDIIAGENNVDDGNIEDGGSVLTSSQAFAGTPFTSSGTLWVTNRVTDLEAGEAVVLRINVKLGCQAGADPTGNLQADLINANVVVQDGSPVNDTINAGNQTINFKQVGDIAGTGEPFLVVFKSVTNYPAGTCPGVSEMTVTQGDTVRYCLTVSNPGTTNLYDVVLKDDNGTPANTADDFIIPLTGLVNLGGNPSIGDLGSGGTATGSYLATYSTPGSFTNTAYGIGNNGLNGNSFKSLTNTATAIVHVLPASPVAVDDFTNTTVNVPVVIGVTNNDSASTNCLPFFISAVTDPPNGTATINPDGTITYVPDPGFIGTDTFSYTITDSCGGSDMAIVTVTITDNSIILPTITCAADLAVACASQIPAPDTAAPVTAGSCTPLTVTHEGDSLSFSNCANGFTVFRTYKVTDSCSNFATCTQTITVNDTNAPSITCPAAVTVSCASQIPTPDTANVTAGDNCGGSPVVTFEGDSVSASNCVDQFTITRTYKTTDACGNFATCTQTITVDDTNAPSVTCPAAVTVSCASQVPAADTASVTAGDNCGGLPVVTFEGDSVSASNCVDQFTITRTYRATDICGNSATCTQTITVNDTNAPSIICPTAVTVDCASQIPAPDTNSVTANDGCGGAVTIEFVSDSVGASNCVNQFTVTRTYRATDLCGNSATCTQTITVNDTNAPSITCPTAVTVSCASQIPAPDTNSVTANDGCGGAVKVEFVSDSVGASNCVNQFTVTRTYRATDLCGNSATCTQTITVNDTNAPSISCPAAVTVSCASQVPAADTASVTAGDNCGGSPVVTFEGDSVSASNCVNQFTITRIYKATDACGNFATCTQTITVNDTNAPSITPSGTTLTLGCNPSASDINAALGSATAWDNCGPATAIPSDSVVTSNGCSRSQTRTWNATDACGNAATSVSRTVTWTFDTQPPTIVCPPTVTLVAGGTYPAIATNYVMFSTQGGMASDNCGGALTLSYYSEATNSAGSATIITRTYKVKDACGNESAACTQTIQILPKGLLTNTERCQFDCNSAAGQQIRVLFTPDTTAQGCYKLNASNPGQFFYNVFLSGVPGSAVSFTVSVPYPFVTQGAVPVHVYDGVTVYAAPLPLDGTCPSSMCLAPANDVSSLFTYTPGAITAACGPLPGTAKTMTVTGIIPPSGFAFVAIHLDYGLEGCTGYSLRASGSLNNAVACGTTNLLVPDLQSYAFRVTGSQNTTNTAQTFNIFKKNPGVGGSANSSSIVDAVAVLKPKPNCAAVLSSGIPITSKNKLQTGVSDQDGWYVLPYKYTGKATTLYITLTPPGGAALTRSITIKANGYVQVDFTVP